MNKYFRYKVIMFVLLYIALVYMDYRYHSFLAETSFRNYEWLAYFKYDTKHELIYSCDIIVGSILFLIILVISIIKKNIKNFIFVIFPIICIIMHEITLNLS